MINAFCVGEDLAYETGREHVNVLIAKDHCRQSIGYPTFTVEKAARWRMVHHHVDFDPTLLKMVDLEPVVQRKATFF